MTRSRNLTRTVAALVCAIAVGCAGSPTAAPATAAAATAVLQMTATPATIVAVVCPSAHCGSWTGQLEVIGSVTIRESGGVAGVVNRVGFTVRRRSDNAAVAANEEAAGTRIAANGSLTVPVMMHFDEALAES